ncbi:MAG: U32 family peptidase [Burkholderiaceae bacterium]|nr:U32 family peptidase [Burkholderiaceae bacterium]
MLKLAMGPITYYWTRDAVFKFYETVAATPVEIVYLGETVCSRRHEVRLADWLDIAALLEAAGKEVVLSTQALIESSADLTTLRKITANGRFAVEANDMGAVHCLKNQLPFVAGPHLNIYNSPTLDLLAKHGAKRWVMPLEMGKDGLAQMQRNRPTAMETEVFAYGRMPLAFSSRCFTARHRNLPKDDCQFSCLDYQDGLLLQTRESQPFLILNGIQTQSSQVYNLLDSMAEMQALGVDVLRISPQSQHIEQVVESFDAVRHDRLSPDAAMQRMVEWMPAAACNGYWLGKPGLEYSARSM